MAHALAEENKQFIREMIQKGRFNNQSEVIREALRRMERAETTYLNPAPLTEQETRLIYGPNPTSDQREQEAVRNIRKSLRGIAERRKLKLDDL